MNDIADQYRTITEGAGWIERSARGRLRFDGVDATAFLQAQLTNDIAGLREGDGAYALLLTPQGRIITDLVVFHRGSWLLAEVAEGAGEALAERFENTIFTEDVRVSDVTSAFAAIEIIGERAAAIVASATALDERQLASMQPLASIAIPDGFVARTDAARLPSFQVIVAPWRRDAVLAQLEAAGARAISAATSDALRIEHARPAFGVDMTSETIPLEAGLLDRAISTTKGCYVGQEVIVRVLHRGGGRVAKRLVVLDVIGSDSAPAAGTALTIGDRESGRITSAAFSPAARHVIALGYLHRDDAEVGRRVMVGDTGAEAVVAGFAG